MALFDVRLCGRAEVVVVDGGSFTPAINEIYELSGSRGEIYCGEILNESVETTALYTATTQYDTCLICVTASSVNNYYVFEDCNNEASTINVSPLEFETIASLGDVPGVGDVYDITSSDGPGKPSKSSCFKFREVVYTEGAATTVTLVSVTPYSLCSLCNWETNSVVVEVEWCGHPDEFYYVQIPIGAGPFISFIPIGETPDQYCGEIIQTADTTTTATFLSSFDGCTECEAQTQVKRELISCIDGSTEVVFASALYDVGETGFVSTIDPEVNLATCYEIGNITEATVTITSYLEYFPSQGCDECFSCNPIGIEYIPCNWEGTPLTAITYQFVQIEPDQLFLHPIYGCSYVTQYFEPIDGSEIIYSFIEFSGDCSSDDCLLYEYETWLVETCDGGTFGYVTTPIGLFTTGDTTMVKVGLYDDFCVTFIENTEDPGRYDFVGITNQTNYGDCPTCLEQRTRGVIIVNCRTNEELKVKMYESQIQQIGGGIFTDEQLNCYYLFDDCNKDDSTPLFNAFLLYDTCGDCINPKSANTPTTICVICCDCGATGSTVNIVTPPYPTWTDQYGKAVVQTNMVVIGGNGLNG
jgi:hypothetical protein